MLVDLHKFYAPILHGWGFVCVVADWDWRTGGCGRIHGRRTSRNAAQNVVSVAQRIRPAGMCDACAGGPNPREERREEEGLFSYGYGVRGPEGDWAVRLAVGFGRFLEWLWLRPPAIAI